MNSTKNQRTNIMSSQPLTTAGKDEGLGGVDSDAPHIVRVCLKLVNSLQGVVVVHPHLHVIRARHHPILARHKPGGSHRQVTYLSGCEERGVLREVR